MKIFLKNLQFNEMNLYLSCTSCEKWYHLRCTNIGDVLPGLLSKNIKSSAVDFYCGLDGCNSDGSYCIYKEKKFKCQVSNKNFNDRYNH